MKRALMLVTLGIFGLVGSAFGEEGGNCAHDKSTFRCVRYIRNYDGDTLTVDIPNVHPLLGDHVSVRVRHIDTPEIKGTGSCEKEKARTAQRLAENLLAHAKRIDLIDVDRDKYFRVLATVLVDGERLDQILVKNGLAYSYEGGTKSNRDWCERKPAQVSRP